jgi:hypothetical protein
VLGTRRGASKHGMKWMYMRCRGSPGTPSKVKECHGVNADMVQTPGQLTGLHPMRTAVAIGQLHTGIHGIAGVQMHPHRLSATATHVSWVGHQQSLNHYHPNHQL